MVRTIQRIGQIMDAQSNREIEIFNSALEQPTPAERAAYLDGACRDDAELRARIEALIRADEQAGGFLPTEDAKPQAAELAKTFAMTTGQFPITEKAGDRIGRYKLLQQIGEGGCGVVYMAEQQEPVRRKVALKIIKLGMDTKSVIARFEAERQALALMDHPNIAKVLDAGATEAGRPYFVMELVHGTKITDYSDEHNLDIRTRLDLFIQVCQAVQHAHQKGIIHRDIKPSNILVTLRDGVPVPKVIDFGIAKATTDQRLTDKTVFTAFEQFMGTPAYMSPEQAEMSEQGIDTRSDIYSLGILLYELLTGGTPFDAKQLLQSGLDAMRKTIRETEPPRPSTKLGTMLAADLGAVAQRHSAESPKLVHLIRGDLDWIVMKALEKDRTRRYETANGLAADIKRHLNSEPVVARPPSNLYRLEKLVRRNRLASFAALAIFISLLAGLVATNYFRFKERQVLHDPYLTEARALRISGRAGQRFDSLRAVQKAAAIRRDAAVRDAAIAALALTDLRWINSKNLPRGTPGQRIRFNAPFDKYACVGKNGNIAIRSVADDHTIAELAAPGLRPVDLCGFSSDSRYLKVVYFDSSHHATHWVWDVTEQNPVLKSLPGGRMDLGAFRFSPNSRFLSRSSLDGICSIYDLSSGQEVKHLNLRQGYNDAIMSPDDTLLAANSDGVLRVDIRELATGSNILTLACPASVTTLAWSLDSKKLAVGCDDARIYLWNIPDGTQPLVLAGHFARITGLTFNHAGDLLGSGSWDGVARLWDVFSGKTIAALPGTGFGDSEFTPDDQSLGPIDDGATKFGLSEVAHHGEYRLLANPYARQEYGAIGVDFSADGRIVTAGTEGHVCFWDVVTGKEIGEIPTENSWSKIFHPDGTSLLISDRTNGITVRSLEKMETMNSITYRLGSPRLLFAGRGFREAAISRDSHLAVAQHEDGDALVFDLQRPSAKPVRLCKHYKIDYISISADGHWAAAGSWHTPWVRIWDARTGDYQTVLEMPARTRITFSPDGKWLATATTEYQLWHVGTWLPKGVPIPGQKIPQDNSLAFNSDGRLMAITEDLNKIQLRETASGKVLATLESPDAITLANLRFSPDDTRLAASRNDGNFELWDLRLIRRELAEMNLDWDQPPFPPLADEEKPKPVTMEIETGTNSPTKLP
jgi:serine/threonine protein kinase/WD40 repeat protein